MRSVELFSGCGGLAMGLSRKGEDRAGHTLRFNRRFYPMTAFNSILGVACRVVAPTYAQLYSGAWEHPTGPRAAAA